MQRRKYLAALGSLAAGGAAVGGTGAFGYMNAERTVSINVAGDANAFLGIVTSQSKYARQSGNTAEIVLNGNSGGPGNGVNDDADTRFDGVLKLVNNGDNDVSVGVDDNDSVEDAFQIWVDTDQTFTGSSATRIDNGQKFILEVGEAVYLHVAVFLLNNSAGDLPDTLTLTADNSIPGGAIDP